MPPPCRVQRAHRLLATAFDGGTFAARSQTQTQPAPRRHIRRYTPQAANVLKPSIYGQPLATSHPHLVKPHELTPGIPAEEYERRRRALMDSLPDDSLVVAVAGQIKYMSGNIFYKFRQASVFWYLTGFQEPDSAVIMEKNSSSKGYRMTLFCTGLKTEQAKWDGARTTFDDVETIFKADEVRSIDRFESHLKSLLPAFSTIYADLTATSRRKPKSFTGLFGRAPSGGQGYDSLIDGLASSRRKSLTAEVNRIRVVKSEVEQKVMREAADISGKAHTKTMRFTRPGQSEAALAAHFEYIAALSGAQRLAYVPVVASGANALIIHYTSNDHLVQDGDLVLIDGGCEYNGYASDVTRTFPANGTFTEPQRDLYSAVLVTQKACIALCHESSGMSLNDIHRASCEYLRVELNQLGFELHTGDLERILYPHYLTHPIGIDLHESEGFDRSAPMKAGMVITIEPGVYVPESPAWPKHFQNIGIRIEDEVLVGEQHPVVLSVNAPREIVDVEGACQGSLGLEPY